MESVGTALSIQHCLAILCLQIYLFFINNFSQNNLLKRVQINKPEINYHPSQILNRIK